MVANPLLIKISQAMETAGLKNAGLISEEYDGRHLGNAIVIFRLDPMLLRFTRDRSKDFLAIASIKNSERFYEFADVELAMGWKSLEDILAMDDTEPIATVLAQVVSHLSEIKEAFSDTSEGGMTARIEEAERVRGQAFIERLFSDD